MNERILIGIFGRMRANDEATQGYYVVESLTKPYTVQENVVMKGVDPPHTFLLQKLNVTLCFGVEFLMQQIGIH